MLNEKGVIVGISMVSANNVVLKAGVTTSNRQSIKMESFQYPICFYGCLLPLGF
jgi:hypothetical protein